MVRRVSILGATGSIGQNTIDLIRRAPLDYDVVALTGAGNIGQLARDAIELKADIAVTARDDLLDDLRAALKGSGVQAAAGATAKLRYQPHNIQNVTLLFYLSRLLPPYVPDGQPAGRYQVSSWHQ